MEWFYLEVVATTDKTTRKSISSGEVFPKIIREAQSDKKTLFNALKYVFLCYKTRWKHEKRRKTRKTAKKPKNPKNPDFQGCPYRPLMAGFAGEMPTESPEGKIFAAQNPDL